MAVYVILRSADQPVSTGDPVPFGELSATIEELAGRNCQPWLAANLHRKGRCYVATAKDAPGRALYGRGFVVRKVPPSMIAQRMARYNARVARII